MLSRASSSAVEEKSSVVYTHIQKALVKKMLWVKKLQNRLRNWPIACTPNKATENFTFYAILILLLHGSKFSLVILKVIKRRRWTMNVKNEKLTKKCYFMFTSSNELCKASCSSDISLNLLKNILLSFQFRFALTIEEARRKKDQNSKS